MSKKLKLILFLSFFTAAVYSQSFDWNIRGGLNLMNAQPSDGEIFLGYHAGAQAGVRISYYGIYGEALYSVHQNQDGGDPVAYIMPGLNFKRYIKKFLFVELGGSLLIPAGDTDLPDNSLNPENVPVLSAGMGGRFSVLELSLRATSKSGYGVFQVTAALNF